LTTFSGNGNSIRYFDRPLTSERRKESKREREKEREREREEERKRVRE
jgi:hypothetical protein